jgi:hypothetical protein
VRVELPPLLPRLCQQVALKLWQQDSRAGILDGHAGPHTHEDVSDESQIVVPADPLGHEPFSFSLIHKSISPSWETQLQRPVASLVLSSSHHERSANECFPCAEENADQYLRRTLENSLSEYVCLLVRDLFPFPLTPEREHQCVLVSTPHSNGSFGDPFPHFQRGFPTGEQHADPLPRSFKRLRLE